MAYLQLLYSYLFRASCRNLVVYALPIHSFIILRGYWLLGSLCNAYDPYPEQADGASHHLKQRLSSLWFIEFATSGLLA